MTSKYRGADSREEERQGVCALPVFCNHLLCLFFFLFVFCNHFEELQTVFLEVELIINNAPLTYVYPNTTETCLTPNHLLFSRQLLYSSNTASRVVTNLTVLSCTTDKINHISNHFCDKWRHEYVVNLRETQRTSKLNIKSPKINVNDIVLVYDEKVPRHFSRIAIVTVVLRNILVEIMK